MKKVLSHIKPYKWLIVLTVALTFIQVMCELYLPDINADIIDKGVAAGDSGYIWSMGGKMLIVSVFMGLSALGAAYFSSKISMSFGRDLRHDLFSRVIGFSQQEIDIFGTPSLIIRTTNDVTQVQNAFMMMMRMMLMAPIMCVGGIIMALKQDTGLSLILVIVIPLIVLIMAVVFRRALPLFTSMQKKIDNLNQVMREKLSGVRVIRAFIRDTHEQKRFDEANLDLTDTALRINYIMVVMFPAMMLIMSLCTLAAYWFGVVRIDIGAMQIGNLTAFLTYLMQILFSVTMSVMMFIMLPRAIASIKRMNAVLETRPTVLGGTGHLSGSLKEFSFNNVSFSYPGAQEPVLQNISFSVRPGQTLAIIGSTGSGKSTLINLISRVYDITDGQILINGQNITSVPLEELREHVSFIPQQSFLFDGTVASNLLDGNPDATEEQMWRALSIAQGADFIRDNGGLDYEIMQGGRNVSGGQRQRLCIARALVKDADLLIFDDSFSALDFATDARLRRSLQENLTHTAVIIVGQRVSTIRHADQILVLDEGRIAGLDTHENLMKDCEVYREIVLSQLSEEEAV